MGEFTFSNALDRLKRFKIRLFLDKDQYVEGTLLDVKEDHLMLEMNGKIYYFALDQIHAITKNAKDNNPLSLEFPLETKKDLNALLEELRYSWVTITCNSNQVFKGMLSKVTKDFLILINKEEQMYILKTSIINIFNGLHENDHSDSKQEQSSNNEDNSSDSKANLEEITESSELIKETATGSDTETRDNADYKDSMEPAKSEVYDFSMNPLVETIPDSDTNPLVDTVSDSDIDPLVDTVSDSDMNPLVDTVSDSDIDPLVDTVSDSDIDPLVDTVSDSKAETITDDSMMGIMKNSIVTGDPGAVIKNSDHIKSEVRETNNVFADIPSSKGKKQDDTLHDFLTDVLTQKYKGSADTLDKSPKAESDQVSPKKEVKQKENNNLSDSVFKHPLNPLGSSLRSKKKQPELDKMETENPEVPLNNEINTKTEIKTQIIDAKDQKLALEKQYFSLMKHAEYMYKKIREERLRKTKK
ncbi:DUF2642 domain-containing protein [Niallia taxi]|uniref:DUF2642 domain-containing protein n=1 Tax=Niallia taxi TaxID=2499688 RepID=UPI0020408453|nr:DUF2642 domain-containing protein [Niallia taxi]MCM3215143.1 DUF2642 domain-containing protein [Niallia taxi]